MSRPRSQSGAVLIVVFSACCGFATYVAYTALKMSISGGLGRFFSLYEVSHCQSLWRPAKEALVFTEHFKTRDYKPCD